MVGPSHSQNLSEEDKEAGKLDEAEEVVAGYSAGKRLRRCHWILAKKRSTCQRRL
jgi:hypothetical protein